MVDVVPVERRGSRFLSHGALELDQDALAARGESRTILQQPIVIGTSLVSTSRLLLNAVAIVLGSRFGLGMNTVSSILYTL
jgi:hypothetical protein